MAELIMAEETSVSTPASGTWKAYFKSTGLFVKDDAGNEVGPLGAVNASINMFLENTASDIAGYKSLAQTVPSGGSVNDSASISAADTVINEYANSAGLFTFVPAQVAQVHLHMAQTAGTKTSTAYVKLFHRTSGGTETLIGTSAVSPTLAGVETEYNFDVFVSDTVFASTDRFVLKVYASPGGAGTTPTVNVYFQGTSNSRVSLSGSSLASTGSVSGPQGFLINGKLSVTVASNNITVAIKTLAGNDPSVSAPVYVRIGDTIRTISAALSVTKNAGTNWCNAGSTEFATKEIDYFVYLGYNATDGVVIGFSRIPYANRYDDFSATSTNEKYAAISTITNAAAGDYYENVGRFAATLSAGAGYTWTVPTFTASNLINHPVYDTRWLTYQPVWGGTTGSAGTYALTTNVAKYRLDGRQMNVAAHLIITNVGSWTGTTQVTLPFAPLTDYLPMSGTEVASAGNPLAASKGMPYTKISSPGTVRFLSSAGAAELAMASVSANDVALVNGAYDY